jgi:uncharacterized surface protein with fasciclin (FAS1) repeats
MKFLNTGITATVLAILVSACGEIKENKAGKQVEALETAENMEVEAPDDYDSEMAATIRGLTRQDERFDTLNAALEKANMQSTLRDDLPYTVFAPTDEAFKNLPEGKLDALYKEGNEVELTSVLSYHVVSGKHTVSDIKKGIEGNNGAYTLETLEGSRITFTLDGSEVVLAGVDGGEARIVDSEVEATNGVIHGIDRVVMFK